MRMRALLMLGAAVVLGLASVFLLQRWVEQRAVARAPAPATHPVVVASAPLAFGKALTRDNIQVVNWPAGSVPAGSFSKLDEVLSEKEDRVVIQPMEKGEPVLKSKVTGFGGRATLSTVIDEKMRAITIAVNDVLGVAGFVLPGDRVDILLTRKQNQASPTTDILLQNVRVLGIDQSADVKKDKPSVARAVTLEVSPTQAQKLALAATVGTLSLALRNITNADDVPVRPVGLRDLGVGEVVAPKPAPAPVAKRANPLAQVRVYRGTKETNMEVRRD